MKMKWGHPCRGCSRPVFTAFHVCPPVYEGRDLENPVLGWKKIRATSYPDAAELLAEKMDMRSEAKDERKMEAGGQARTITVICFPTARYQSIGV